MKYYIAYGSNLNVEQMSIRCPGSKPVGTAKLQGWKLVFRGCATIEPADGHEVPVVVWKVPGADEVNLDRYEGFPIFYYKKNLAVNMVSLTTKRNRKITAMVYIMNDRFPVEPPSERYFNIISAGYEHFGFDDNVLHEARREALDTYMQNRTKLA